MADRPTASTITDDQLEALYAELERARAERGTYRAAWHSARDRARKHRTAVDDMWDANTRLANRARRAEKQLADERAEHLQAHEQETANTAREIGRAQRAEQQLAAVRALHARNANTGTCEHCSERDYPDYAVPWPCPTIAALDAAGQLDCPGETDPPTCNCPCEGCQHHCAAHQPDTCRTVDIDGETIRVRGAGEMNAEDRGYFAEVVRAARRRYEAEHPDGPNAQSR